MLRRASKLARLTSRLPRFTGDIGMDFVHQAKDSDLRGMSKSPGMGVQLLEEGLGLTKVDGYFAHGFQLNGIQVFGGVVCLQDFWLQWKPTSMEEVTLESLAFLKLFKPLPEMLVLGCGDKMEFVAPPIQKFLKEEEIALEALDTRNAIPLFNLLNLEGRCVIGAFLPVGLTEEEEAELNIPIMVKDL